MKRMIGFVFVFGAVSYVAPGASAAQSETRHAVAAGAKGDVTVGLAPADEYFGILKLSILGIRNSVRDLGLRYDVNHDIPKQTYDSALLTEQAMQDWEHKYPHDRLLPRAVFFLQRLYTMDVRRLRPVAAGQAAAAGALRRAFGGAPDAESNAVGRPHAVRRADVGRTIAWGCTFSRTLGLVVRHGCPGARPVLVSASLTSAGPGRPEAP